VSHLEPPDEGGDGEPDAGQSRERGQRREARDERAQAAAAAARRALVAVALAAVLQQVRALLQVDVAVLEK